MNKNERLKELGIQWKLPQSGKVTDDGFKNGPAGDFFDNCLIGSYTFALLLCVKEAAYPIPGVGDADDTEFWVMRIPDRIYIEIHGKVSCPMPGGGMGCPRYLGLPVSKTKFFPTYDYNPVAGFRGGLRCRRRRQVYRGYYDGGLPGARS